MPSLPLLPLLPSLLLSSLSSLSFTSQDEEEEEEEDEFGGQETLVTARPHHAEHEFAQDNTMVIREDLPLVCVCVCVRV